MSRLFVLTAGVALLVLPRIASALPPTALSPSLPASIQLAQAKPDPGAANPTIAWAQARLSEIDAAITTLEVAARALAADARKRADEGVQKLRTARDAFRARIEVLVADGAQRTDAQLAEARTALDAQWGEFERSLDAYLTSTETGTALRNAVLQARDKAEELYWQQAIATLKTEETGVPADQRPAIDSAIAALQSYADAAHARLDKLQQAGNDAWSAVQSGLSDARQAFDKAYEGVQAAIEKARQ